MQFLVFSALFALASAAPSRRWTTAASQATLKVERDDTGADIDFDACDSSSTVSSINISPCQGGNGSFSSPCEFSYGQNYTITLTYTSPIDSSAPRANLAANDSTSGGLGTYAYSGQSFDACQYTSCPIQQNVTAEYTYNFVTLKSPFDSLTFNTTDGLDGESLMCASFPVTFQPQLAGRSLPRLPFAGLGSRKL